jgi:hypothetical protein
MYKTRVFARWQRKERLSDSALCLAIHEMMRGLFDANLGSGLYKKRVPRTGGGKSGGFRTLLASNLGNRWFFLYGFAKNERDNIEFEELRLLKIAAHGWLEAPPRTLQQALIEGKLEEIACG